MSEFINLLPILRVLGSFFFGMGLGMGSSAHISNNIILASGLCLVGILLLIPSSLNIKTKSEISQAVEK